MVRGLTQFERILSRHTIDGVTVQGGFAEVRPRRIMTHDNTAAVIPKFKALFGHDAPRMAIRDQAVITLDHDIQNHSAENLGRYAAIEKFARLHDVPFSRAGAGIGHQIMVEQGYVRPGDLVVASDSHSNMYGAIGAAGLPVVRTDAAVIWATGRTWLFVPPVVRVELRGMLREHVAAKDVIVALCGHFPVEVQNCAVEFVGDGLHSLTMSERFTIANMTTEWGAAACTMHPDERAVEYALNAARTHAASGDAPSRGDIERGMVSADPDAVYAATITLDLGTVSPSIAGPNSVSLVRSVASVATERIRVDRAYLVSCVNARLDDFQVAASIAAGRTFASHVRFAMAAASDSVEQEARRLGYWDTLLRAGAKALPSGCGPCIGLGEETVGAGEIAISSSNRNFPGRMGDRTAQVYLASPAVVVASAIAGWIDVPQAVELRDLRANYERRTVTGDRRWTAATDTSPTDIIRGRAILLPQPDISTDAIYASRWTYKNDLSRAQMAAVIFENLDPALAATVRAGDIILAGPRFGCGSSREQAATALAAAGIAAVVAESVNSTYMRNAINNGLLCLECPGMASVLDHIMCRGERDVSVSIDLDRGELAINDLVLPLTAPPPFLMSLVRAGGIEPWAHERIAALLTKAGATR